MQDAREPHELNGKHSVQAIAVNSRFLLDIHLNEYQALMTRSTYYVVMSTAIWPLIFLYLGLLATAWQHLPAKEYGFPLIVWAGGFGVQLALWFWTFLVCEQYKTVLYIERNLRPLVQALVGTPTFWQYEPFLKQQRRTPLSRWLELQTEFWVVISIITAVLVRILMSHHFTLWDWIGLAVNVVVLAILILLAVSAAKTRHQWESVPK
jgi:hypothetical protein